MFFSQSLRSLSVTASLFPSSKFLASALLRHIDFEAADVIVELGIGTGAITKEILRRLKPSAVLLGMDLNPAFVSYVRRKFQDPRFIPIVGQAERLGALLNRHGLTQADAIVSSLGLSAMRPSQRSTILTQAAAHLKPEGVLTQYQYLAAGGRFQLDFVVRSGAIRREGIPEGALSPGCFGASDLEFAAGASLYLQVLTFSSGIAGLSTKAGGPCPISLQFTRSCGAVGCRCGEAPNCRI
ncbi:MAG: methyltransferase domain-containing protein [Ignavibacteriota bacterium]